MTFRVRLYDNEVDCQTGCDQLFQEYQELYPHDTHATHYGELSPCNEGWYHKFLIHHGLTGVYLTGGITTTYDQLTFPDIDV